MSQGVFLCGRHRGCLLKSHRLAALCKRRRTPAKCCLPSTHSATVSRIQRNSQERPPGFSRGARSSMGERDARGKRPTLLPTWAHAMLGCCRRSAPGGQQQRADNLTLGDLSPLIALGPVLCNTADAYNLNICAAALVLADTRILTDNIWVWGKGSSGCPRWPMGGLSSPGAV